MQEIFNYLNQQIIRLVEVIHASETNKNDYICDAALRRFTLTIELFWKVLKKILTYEEIDTTTPRDVMSKVFQFNIIDDEQMWLEMLKDLNVTSHVYKYENAKQVFENIKLYLPILEKTYNKLEKNILDEQIFYFINIRCKTSCVIRRIKTASSRT